MLGHTSDTYPWKTGGLDEEDDLGLAVGVLAVTGLGRLCTCRGKTTGVSFPTQHRQSYTHITIILRHTISHSVLFRLCF